MIRVSGVFSGRTIFVVVGEAGEYSDRVTWIAAAFIRSQDAADFVIAATARSREIKTLSADERDEILYGDAEELAEWASVDPGIARAGSSADDARYSMIEIELRGGA